MADTGDVAPWPFGRPHADGRSRGNADSSSAAPPGGGEGGAGTPADRIRGVAAVDCDEEHKLPCCPGSTQRHTSLTRAARAQPN